MGENTQRLEPPYPLESPVPGHGLLLLQPHSGRVTCSGTAVALDVLRADIAGPVVVVAEVKGLVGVEWVTTSCAVDAACFDLGFPLGSLALMRCTVASRCCRVHQTVTVS